MDETEGALEEIKNIIDEKKVRLFTGEERIHGRKGQNVSLRFILLHQC